MRADKATLEVSQRRTWRERLLTWPWRPWRKWSGWTVTCENFEFSVRHAPFDGDTQRIPRANYRVGVVGTLENADDTMVKILFD